MTEKVGIVNTEKLINVIKGNVLNLLTIDYAAIKNELENLDADEKRELLVDLGEAVLDVIAKVDLGSPVLHGALKLLYLIKR